MTVYTATKTALKAAYRELCWLKNGALAAK